MLNFQQYKPLTVGNLNKRVETGFHFSLIRISENDVNKKLDKKVNEEDRQKK